MSFQFRVSPNIWIVRLGKFPSSTPVFRSWDFQKFHAVPPLYKWKYVGNVKVYEENMKKYKEESIYDGTCGKFVRI